jgi:NADH-quinone oxidoreductase subunit D
MPYSGYEKFQFAVPVSNGRRMGPLRRPHSEMREPSKSASRRLTASRRPYRRRRPKIILPDREQMKTQMESLIHHFKIITEGLCAGR